MSPELQKSFRGEPVTRTPSQRQLRFLLLFECSLCARPRAGHFLTLMRTLQAAIVIPSLPVKNLKFRVGR